MSFMYVICTLLAVHCYPGMCIDRTKDLQTSNMLAEAEDTLFSDSDKSYKHALVRVTPVINQDVLTDSRKKYDFAATPNSRYLLHHSSHTSDFHTVERNPITSALVLSSSLGIEPKSPGFNHPQHLATNPYVALLLSHYGRYVPVLGVGRGIYGYAAANNYHNNKPFGSYKIYEDRDV